MKRCWIAAILMLAMLTLAGCGTNGIVYEKIVGEYDTISSYYKVTGYTGEDAELTIPAKYQSTPVTFIGKEAFAGNQIITKVILPEGLAELRDRAFADCPNLTEVQIPSTISRMGEDVFAGSDKVTLIVTSGGMAEAYAMEAGIPYRVQG